MNNQNGGSNKSAERSGFDNKCVHVCSTYSELRKMSKVKIWHSKEKKFFDVYCPNTISEYKESIGDVDSAVMLIAVQSQNQNQEMVFQSAVQLCWHRDGQWLAFVLSACWSNESAKNRQLSLSKFICEIVQSLVKGGKAINRVGRPSKGSRSGSETPSPVPRKQPAPVPCKDVSAW